MDLDAIEGLESDTTDGGSDDRVAGLEKKFDLLLAAMQDSRRGGGSSSSAVGGGGGVGRAWVPRGPPSIPHLSEKEVKEYMAANMCFGCKSKDHQSRQCPKRVVKDSRPSWTN